MEIRAIRDVSVIMVDDPLLIEIGMNRVDLSVAMVV